MTRLEAIRARLEAATPGPWVKDVTGVWAGGEDNGRYDANAALIAHAPDDLRLLLTVAEAVEEMLAFPHLAKLWDADSTTWTEGDLRRAWFHVCVYRRAFRQTLAALDEEQP